MRERFGFKIKVGDLVQYDNRLTVMCGTDPDAIGIVVETQESNEAFEQVLQRCLVRWASKPHPAAADSMGDSFYYYEHQLIKVD